MIEEYKIPENKKYKIIKKDCEDLFSYYDVDENCIVRNERGKKISQVYDYIVTKMKVEYKDLWDELDYFSIDCDIRYSKKGTDTPFPFDCKWIAVFYVRGSNEGQYFHIESIDGDKRRLLFLGKTLSSDRELAIKINAAFSRILEV